MVMAFFFNSTGKMLELMKSSHYDQCLYLISFSDEYYLK